MTQPSAETNYEDKPVRRLRQTLVLLVVFLAVSIAVIATAKLTGDRRLRGSILTETILRANDFIKRGNYDRADSELDAALRAQPALAVPLCREFEGFMPIFPRFRSTVARLGTDLTNHSKGLS